MIPIHDKVVKSAISLFQKDIKAHHRTLASKLKNIARQKSVTGKKLSYIKKLISISDKVITLTPQSILRHKREFDKILKPESIAGKKYEKFRKKLFKAIGYENKRDNFYPKYFQAIGIKACVYCNSQLTVSINREAFLKTKKKNIIKAKFQVDHYLPKSDYPCFGISLYNLYPSCASCNNSKSDNNVYFSLYSSIKPPSKSEFIFELDMASVTNYILDRKAQEIKFKFIEPKKKRGRDSFNETFDVQGIYNTQKDLAEELILKSEIYTPSYKISLARMFPKIFKNDPVLIDRMILGNYPFEKDLHKRPMSKFSIDIARQVGLIT